MTSLSDDNQSNIIEAFNSTTRYLDDLLNIDNPYFEGLVNQVYPPELLLNKVNTSDTEAPFLDLHLSISNGCVSSKNNSTSKYIGYDSNDMRQSACLVINPITVDNFTALFNCTSVMDGASESMMTPT